MNISTVNELIQSLESAGELSIREQKFLKLAKAHVQLAAENVALKQAAEFATAPDMWIEQADGMLDYRYHEWYVDVLKAAMETPATDRIYAGIKADAAAPLVSALKVIANSEQHNGDTVVCDFDTLISVAAGALRDYYAQQLREGAK
ncbi:hypothetical protein GJJ09_22885 [Klebsiella pneumoniae]|uniref:hypothetical protein n=1 Tax=Klebsiella pneumoniae TaxID=573 RepID=UPI001090B9E6|nr:hypothetical protein [Klebsiella pneumoniae]EKU2991741.1 hypothetical protein [Klebsiella pneumoniae]EKX6827692.1 hypothetical protein [Klebsiella pneumoniae]ELA1532499.1 hypothetical protein [Klebsiella pneumoniae]MRJ69049.1 hypothetical protein [Klebsiella pneumoniae]VGH95931.1 Uncharacterised protein [Klebsiella pneumoniae]